MAVVFQGASSWGEVSRLRPRLIGGDGREGGSGIQEEFGHAVGGYGLGAGLNRGEVGLEDGAAGSGGDDVGADEVGAPGGAGLGCGLKRCGEIEHGDVEGGGPDGRAIHEAGGGFHLQAGDFVIAENAERVEEVGGAVFVGLGGEVGAVPGNGGGALTVDDNGEEFPAVAGGGGVEPEFSGVIGGGAGGIVGGGADEGDVEMLGVVHDGGARGGNGTAVVEREGEGDPGGLAPGGIGERVGGEEVGGGGPRVEGG